MGLKAIASALRSTLWPSHHDDDDDADKYDDDGDADDCGDDDDDNADGDDDLLWVPEGWWYMQLQMC